MQLTITPTNEFASADGVPMRVWQGVSDRGIRCLVLVRRIAIEEGEDTAEFERELIEEEGGPRPRDPRRN